MCKIRWESSGGVLSLTKGIARELAPYNVRVNAIAPGSIGTPVLAACSGTVTSVTEDDLLGTCVTITHDGGYESTYANLQSVPTVGEGQYVSAGQIIGSVGTTSLIEAGSAAHLHFAVKRDGVSIDPKEFLK